MEQIEIKNLSFKYPLNEKKALDNVTLSISKGEYIVICGKSGCGKTTLLKHLKPVIAPKGEVFGEVLVDKEEIKGLSIERQAEKIGFVMQDSENQIVTDKVWHELSFGLENLGLEGREIRSRVAEMSVYFGIEGWFNKSVEELSGGQKQIMNLAAILAMHPQILILDEPTAQLDPVSAERFLSAVNKANKDFGITIILTEHRLEEVFGAADKVVVMDSGRVVCSEAPKEILKNVKAFELIKNALPSAMKIYSQHKKNECPISVKEARRWLNDVCEKGLEIKFDPEKKNTDFAIEIKELSFSYSKNEKNILKAVNLKIPKGEIFALTGGNGAGKSTLLKIIGGVLKPNSGKIKINGQRLEKSKTHIALLPQNTSFVFTEKTLELDFKTVSSNDEKIKSVCSLVQIEGLCDSHPYDLSGGERQRAALAKLLLINPDILLLDEPTKGMDADFKDLFASVLKNLKKQGVTVVMVSHDVEFCAKHADCCAMLFDGEISSTAASKRFFASNMFYTTAAGRISRGIIKNAVTCEDVIKCLKKD